MSNYVHGREYTICITRHEDSDKNTAAASVPVHSAVLMEQPLRTGWMDVLESLQYFIPELYDGEHTVLDRNFIGYFRFDRFA